MSHAKTALLVIDVQQSFRHTPYFTEEELSQFLSAQQRLIDAAEASGVPVVQIFHVDGDYAFAEKNGFIRALDGIRITPAVTFRKGHHSAFVGTGLNDWLKDNGIERLIVSGIRTEQCCETTTRHGSDLGYNVDFVTEATLTFPMTHASGETFTAEQIKTRTELVLAGRFARIATVEEALSGARDAA